MSTVTLQDKIDWEDETADLAGRLLVAAWQADGDHWKGTSTMETVTKTCFTVADIFMAERRRRRDLISRGAAA